MKDFRSKQLRVVNLGLEVFADELKNQNVPVTHVRWRPPAGGKPRLLEILEKLEELDG
ncbi:MAG: fdrA domain protein [Nitrospinae bacterium]|nr:fdrA domain protein [Nitrospinota bacterium]